MEQRNETIQDAFDDVLGDILGSALTPKFDGQCQHPGCENQGFSYDYPKLDETDEPPKQVYCSVHAKANGFCIGCGGYYGGIESFDFSDGYLCDECQTLNNDEYCDRDFDDDDDDEYY